MVSEKFSSKNSKFYREVLFWHFRSARMFRLEDRRQKVKGSFWHFGQRLLNPNMVIQMCVIDRCFPVNVVLFITLYTLVLVLDLYIIKSYYGVNWHKLT